MTQMLVDMIAEAEPRRYPPDILALFRRFNMRALHLQVPARPGHEGMPGAGMAGGPPCSRRLTGRSLTTG